LHPFLEATFQNAPLPADFKGRDLPILDHSMKSSFGNFQNARGFGEGQKLDGAIGLFHKSPLLRDVYNSKLYAMPTRQFKYLDYNDFAGRARGQKKAYWSKIDTFELVMTKAA
jgi:hypothetical protein